MTVYKKKNKRVAISSLRKGFKGCSEQNKVQRMDLFYLNTTGTKNINNNTFDNLIGFIKILNKSLLNKKDPFFKLYFVPCILKGCSEQNKVQRMDLFYLNTTGTKNINNNTFDN